MFLPLLGTCLTRPELDSQVEVLVPVTHWTGTRVMSKALGLPGSSWGPIQKNLSSDCYPGRGGRPYQVTPTVQFSWKCLLLLRTRD